MKKIQQANELAAEQMKNSKDYRAFHQGTISTPIQTR
jgi:hypothetical protein